MTITSPHNQRLKEIRKLRTRRREREKGGRFVAEGEDLLAAADAAGWTALERFCAAGSGLAGIEVESELLARASGLASGTRTLAVYEEAWAPAPRGPVCLYLHGVHDPGNVGTILRAAEAFGAAGVALGPGCADPFSPKAVRASMGAIFSVPVTRVEAPDDPAEIPAALPGRTIALVAGAGLPLSELLQSAAEGWTGLAEATLLVGSERAGLPLQIQQAADASAHIPIRTESLNAAMAATVALYELTSRMPPR